MDLAPIVLFVYNRLRHTEQTLNALKQNVLSDESTLYIFCDGPKIGASEEEVKKVNTVRELVKAKQWCKEVHIIERKNNLGLANSVIKGVTEIIQKYGKVIVLEDDIITGTHFLEFMNDALNIYKNETKVYGISGYKHINKKNINDETFFLPIMSSWGYATWRDRWLKINFNGKELLNKVESKNIKSRINFNELDYYTMLKEQVAGFNDSWAVRFQVSMYLDKGIFLYPKTSILKNIGFDGSGVHCFQETERFKQQDFKIDTKIKISKREVRLEKKVLQLYDNKKKSNLFKRLKKSIKKNLPPEILLLINRKLKKKSEFEKMLLLPRYTETSITLLGVRIKLPDNASYSFMYKEIFEEEIYKFKPLSDRPYIIDCGANIGLATIYFKKNHPNAEIIAFEPDMNIFKYLQNNIESFKLKDTILLNKGLWNEEKEISFISEGADAGKIQEAEENKNRLSDVKSIKVVSLRPFLNRKVDFLKLDIEGAETVVLEDIEDLLFNVERIFVEYHSFVGQEQTFDKIISILKNSNFRLYINSPGITNKSPFVRVANYNNMDMQLNIYGKR
jgi:FkbM family methyltransferase